MQESSLVILNAHVITLDHKKPAAEAIVVHEGKIVAVGSNDEIREYASKKTKTVNAKGKTVVPGLVDCHVHMTGFGQSLQNLDLRNVESIKEIQKKLREYARKNPWKEWILGRGWDQDRFSEKRYPTRWDLDDAVADKPVFLTRVCGHIGVVNSKALQLAGITNKTDANSRKIDLDRKTGEPNGILRENALDLVKKTIPKPNREELEQTCISACKKATEAGLTCVHWMLESADDLRTIQTLNSEEKLPLRVYLGMPLKTLNQLVDLGLMTGFGNDMVKIGFAKILADGSLGGHTAALEEPYHDKPETKGIMLHTQKELEKLASKAHNAGLQLAVHAIGDHAVKFVLKAFEKLEKNNTLKKRRHRIEHCSVLSPTLIKRMKKLGLIASVQPHFIVSDFWINDRVGKKRARWIFPFKTLINEGITVTSGSDCPVEPINPILGIWAAATRESFPEERLSVEEALKTYTVNAAYATFDENKRGTIEVGKQADLTMLSDNPLTIAKDKIKQITVCMTIVNGKIVYSKD